VTLVDGGGKGVMSGDVRSGDAGLGNVGSRVAGWISDGVVLWLRRR
jgi:hypothetical protein